MLGKLLKYDLKWIYKGLAVFYLLALLFSGLGRLLLLPSNSLLFTIVGKITNGIAIAMMFNALINCFMRCWVRFVRHLYKDESYLTHTLPVEKSSIYMSKIIVSIGSIIISVLVIFLTLFIAYYSKENIEVLKNTLLPIANLYNSSLIRVVLIFIAAFMVETLCILQSGYTGIILGHKMNNNKILFSIVYGLLVYIFTQVFALGLVFILGLFNDNLMNLFITNEVLNFDTIRIVGYLCIFIYFIIFIGNLFINIRLFMNGVDVD